MDTESSSALGQAAKSLLLGVQGRELLPSQLAQHAVQLAATLLKLATVYRSSDEGVRLALLGRMMDDPAGQAFTTLLADRALRTTSAELCVGQAQYLLSELGAPEYLSRFDQLKLSALRNLGGLAPELAARGMRQRIQDQANAYVLTGDSKRLAEYITQRSHQHISVNVNHLGEEVISEDEAQRRVAGYIALLKEPLVRNISVKISSVHSQISALAFERVVDTLCDRLRPIYRAALLEGAARGVTKLVYLDMEAYRDVPITIECFKRLLNEPEFKKLQAGLVLQAYLPDSIAHQRDLLEFAKQRAANGGAPPQLRIVKGANLALERLESAQRGWAVPTFATKAETDASYKRMLLLATRPEHAAVLRVGVASHNLFDVSYGLLLRASRNVEAHVGFELLEGMADALCRALVEVGADVLVYAPFVTPSELPSALAYLVRRLDENTSKENFLRTGFAMRVGDAAWESQQRLFLEACGRSNDAEADLGKPNRGRPVQARHVDADFGNEPDTDFGQPANRNAIEVEFSRVQAKHYLVASQIPGSDNASAEELDGCDPSRPGKVPYRIRLASKSCIERALANAVTAQQRFQVTLPRARLELLSRVAEILRQHRAELTALMVLDGSKRPEEGDVEISEAIDFAEYYPQSYHNWLRTPNVRLRPRGPTVVTPPWNFPLAIPLGGVFAALASGNVVILKPATETALVAQRACELCWEAGVPTDVLQFVVCSDEVATQLITDARTQVVVLTGSTDTARLFRELRPDVPLLAETGGKNALYVSPLADREQAITDVLHSGFGHSGQKCSALSLLILHEAVYDDPEFLRTLQEAALSLRVGSAWELDSRITPLVQQPSAVQLRALTELAAGETWLVEPRIDAENPRLVSPGIKLGVTAGSFSHETEFFCPLISVMRARDLKEALRFANGTQYGLTAGIHSLDEREQVEWLRGCQAGNLYVNRRITGAIVQRQPFGGWKNSSFGPGSKAGGPTYIAQFVSPHAIASPISEVRSPDINADLKGTAELIARAVNPRLDAETRERLRTVSLGYQSAYLEHYSRAVDPSSIRGEDNFLRWVAWDVVFIVADAHTSLEMLARAALAAAVSGAQRRILVPRDAPCTIAAQLLAADIYSSLDDVVDKLLRSDAPRVRYLGTPAASFHHRLRQSNCHVAQGLPTACGRFELLHYLREQTWSVSTHRYGNLTPATLHAVGTLRD